MTANNKNFVLIVVLAVVPIAIYWTTMSTMIKLWSADSFRHGYVIPVVSLLLLWRERSQYATRKSGSWFGAGLLAALVASWLVAEATSVQLIEQLSVVLMVSALALTVLGWDTYKTVQFPLAFLLFAVPAGAAVVPQLMDVTATIAVAALRELGVPALREGMMVSLPGGVFEVVEACSGLNYLNTGVALGVLIAHLMFKTFWKQALYVSVVTAMFILVNGLRAFVVMFVASVSDMRFFVGKDHVVFGWVFFMLTMMLMYWVAEKYSETRVSGPSHASG